MSFIDEIRTSFCKLLNIRFDDDVPGKHAFQCFAVVAEEDLLRGGSYLMGYVNPTGTRADNQNGFSSKCFRMTIIMTVQLSTLEEVIPWLVWDDRAVVDTTADEYCIKQMCLEVIGDEVLGDYLMDL